MKDHHCRKAEIFPRRAMKRTNDPPIGYALEITHLIHASYTVIQIVPANSNATIGEPTRALPEHNLILKKIVLSPAVFQFRDQHSRLETALKVYAKAPL